MYAAGYEQISGLQLEHFYFLVVEKTAPYAVALYELDAGALTAGRLLYQQALTRFTQCKQSSHWPGYPAEIQSLALPGYALPALDFNPTNGETTR